MPSAGGQEVNDLASSSPNKSHARVSGQANVCHTILNSFPSFSRVEFPRSETLQSLKMGALVKLIDLVLFFFFLVLALSAPLIDAQACLPLTLFPDFLIHLKHWYTQQFDDYLFIEKPLFFVGIVWFEILFQWPLCLLNLYALLGSKSWFNTTCLVYGASVFTSMFPILAELLGTGKASDKLLMMYFPFLGLGALSILRGLIPKSPKNSASSGTKTSASARKKKV